MNYLTVFLTSVPKSGLQSLSDVSGAIVLYQLSAQEIYKRKLVFVASFLLELV